ncbi:hypothetical protein IKZ40_00350 [bacterium]|nr:hypothetical protein [bacterium]
MIKRVLVLLLLLSSLFARSAPGDEELKKGRDLLYSARFEEAEKCFLKAQSAAPGSVAPGFFLAAGKLGEITYRGEDEMSLSNLELRVAACCELSLKAKDGEDGKFFLYSGASFLLRASLEARAERYAEALFWAKKALLRFQRAAAFPECASDALMLQSAYDHVLNRAPWPVNLSLDWIVRSAGEQNDLALLEENLSPKSEFEKELRIFLISEYCGLGYPRLAMAHLKELQKSLKDSPFLEIIAIRTEMSSGNMRGAYSSATNLYAKSFSKKIYRPLRADAAFLTGSAAFALGNIRGAEGFFERALKEGESKPRVQAVCMLMLGKCADARGDREEALRRYALVHIHKGASVFVKNLTSKLQRSPGDLSQTIY